MGRICHGPILTWADFVIKTCHVLGILLWGPLPAGRKVAIGSRLTTGDAMTAGESDGAHCRCFYPGQQTMMKLHSESEACISTFDFNGKRHCYAQTDFIGWKRPIKQDLTRSTRFNRLVLKRQNTDLVYRSRYSRTRL